MLAERHLQGCTGICASRYVMSTSPENEFDLEKLFLPAWAQEPSAAKYAKYEGVEERAERRDDRRGPRFRREDRPGGRREDNRPRGEPRPGADRRGRDERRSGERPGFRREEPRERREPVTPLPEIDVSLIPDEKGVESLARQIKMTGRAYPLFGIAQMILQKPERHSVVFSVKKNAEGQPVQRLFSCALDDTIWLSEEEAIEHVLRKHFSTFYQTEKTATEPPKGKYTFVAQCGMSGVILGPPNYHDYQNQLRKLHAERFSRMPFETYKSRVKIVRDEEVVKKWIEDQSFRTEFVCLNLPEPLRLGNMEAVAKHFREVHKDNIIKPVDSHTLTGSAARSLRSSELMRLVRRVWDDQRRFPLQIATVLSQQFAGHGLQFFKVNKAITHVSVARPHYLDLAATPVSEGVKAIVNHINANPKCTRRQLVEALAPSPAPPPVAIAADPAHPPAVPDPNQPTPEQTAVVADLHWLIHQGHVIEFANGVLETAKKPLPKPPKPAPKPAEKAPQSATPPGDAVVAGEASGPLDNDAAPGPGEATVSESVPEVSPEARPEQPLAENPANGTAAPEEAGHAPGMPVNEVPSSGSGETSPEAALAPGEVLPLT